MKDNIKRILMYLNGTGQKGINWIDLIEGMARNCEKGGNSYGMWEISRVAGKPLGYRFGDQPPWVKGIRFPLQQSVEVSAVPKRHRRL